VRLSHRPGVRPSVRPFVTLQYCVNTTQAKITNGLPRRYCFKIRKETNQISILESTCCNQDCESRKICIPRGVRQGCIISPILFNLYSEYMMMEIYEQTKGIEIGGRYYNNIRYADDAVFMSENEADLQDLVLRII